MTIAKGSNTWSAKTDSEGVIVTCLPADSTSLSARVDNSSPGETIINSSDDCGVFGTTCSCNDNGTLTVTDPGTIQIVGASADVPLEAVCTPASTCTMPPGFHGEYENISFTIIQIVQGDKTITTADDISKYAQITGSTLTVNRENSGAPYTVCVQAVSGPAEGMKVPGSMIRIPVHSQTPAAGEILLDIAAGPILITATGYTQGGGTEVLWGDNTNHALTITQSRSGSIANYIQVPADAAITLKNVNLNGAYSGAIPESSDFGPFFIYNNAHVELILQGDNTLQSAVAAAGLEVYTGSTLTIRAPEGEDDSFGKLTAIGGAEAAGIGGSCQRGAGTVRILSGAIDASCSGAYASGIGPGKSQNMEAVEISGVKIDTNGLGGTSLIITGGYFTAAPSDYLAEGYYAVASTESGYDYMVTDQPPQPATVVVTAPVNFY